MQMHNPYAGAKGEWIRGSFHGHCGEHSLCSTVPLDVSAKWYHDVGARFMTVTDHDYVTGVEALEAAYPDMVFLRGFEYSSDRNLLFIGRTVPPLYEMPLADAFRQAGDLLTIVCHPQPRPPEYYWPIPAILALGRTPHGVEIYNGHYGTDRMRDLGHQPCFTGVWDELLTLGQRIWGFANDDFHDPDDFDNAFNMVLVPEVSADAILDAAKHGRCYGSTGLLLESVEVGGRRIRVRTAERCRGRFVGPRGQVLKETEATEFVYIATDEAYIRFEGEGKTGRLFLQPMFQGPVT